MMYEMIKWWSENDSGIACDDLTDYPYIDESSEVVRAGATKMVFIPKEGDYVYKVSTKRCEYFEDACAQEAENYQLAKEYGLEQFFIPTYYWGSYLGYDIYRQEKIATNGDKINTKEYKTSGSYYMDEHEGKRLWHYFDESSLGAIIDYYGVDIAEKLISFVTEYDINDLTSYNCTIDDDGEVKFFDYAGYGED